MEYIVTAKIEVSIIADSPEEADLEALDYLQSTMSVQKVDIEQVREAEITNAHAIGDACHGGLGHATEAAVLLANNEDHPA